MTPSVFNLSIYLDFATIPSLSFVTDFLDNLDNEDEIFLFACKRFPIPERIKSQFPTRIYEPTKNYNPNDCLAISETLERIFLENPDKTFKIKIKLNSYHYLILFKALLKVLLQYQNNIYTIESLDFYDDGSEGFVSLQKLNKFYQNQELLENDIAECLQTLPLILSASEEIKNPHLARYLLNQKIPGKHYLFYCSEINNSQNQDIEIKAFLLKNFPNLSPLFSQIECVKNEFIKPHVSASKNELFKLFFPKIEEQINFLQQFSKNDVYIFISTTFYNFSDEILSIFINLIIVDIKTYAQKLNKNDILLIKLHPEAEIINKTLKNEFKDAENIYFIEGNLPFELLLPYINNLREISGFSSSLFFNVPKELIGEIIFSSSFNSEIRDNFFAFREQFSFYELVRDLKLTAEKNLKMLI